MESIIKIVKEKGIILKLWVLFKIDYILDILK